MIPDLLCIARKTPYPLEAFIFVQRGLEYTVTMIHGDGADPDDPASRHVSGRSLCEGLRQFAVQQYGLLARTVLTKWHIDSCEDFGKIVFAMVDAKLLAKTDEDGIEDFRNAFHFDDAFDETLSFT